MRLSSLSTARVTLNTPTQQTSPKRYIELLFIDQLANGGGAHLYEIGLSLTDLDLKKKPLSSFPSFNKAFHLLGEVKEHSSSLKEIYLTTQEIYSYNHLIQAFGGTRPLLEVLDRKEDCLSFFLALIEALRIPHPKIIQESSETEKLPQPDVSPLTFKDLLISADIQKIVAPKIKASIEQSSTKKARGPGEHRHFRVHT